MCSGNFIMASLYLKTIRSNCLELTHLSNSRI